MSSSMNDNSNGTKGVVAAATTAGNHNATGAQNNKSLGKLINGLQNQSDLDAFLLLVENSEPSLEYLDCLLNTTNQEVLASKKLSQAVGKQLREFIDRIVDPWTPITVTKVIKVLDHLPYDFDTMVSNDLGQSLKKIRKSAKANDDNNAFNEVNNLINKWKKINTDAESTSNGIKRAGSPINNDQTAKKITKLAIQKEAPPRAKAMSNLDFFRNNDRISQPKKIYTRPTYYMEDVVPTVPVESQNTEEPNTARTPARQKKSVRFADNLVEIREYEKNPEEWGNFDNGYHQFGNAGEMEHGEARMAYYHVPQGPWYFPFALELSIGEDLYIRHQIQTEESKAQEAREKTLLAAIYTSLQHIPPSPAEPDEEPDANFQTPIIPLDDITSSQEEILPQQVPQQKQQHIIPQQPYIQALPVMTQTINLSSQPQQQQPQQQQQQQQQQPLQAAVNTPPPRNGITSEAIDEMLKNNPGLMQSLKQLSFLAAGIGSVNNQPQQQQPQQQQPQQQQPHHQPPPPPPPPHPNQFQQQQTYQQSSYQQPQQHQANNNSPQYGYQRRPSPPQQHQRNDFDATREFDRRSKQHKIQKKGNRGGNQRRGGNNTKCIFYTKPEGCRNGEHCTYLH